MNYVHKVYIESFLAHNVSILHLTARERESESVCNMVWRTIDMIFIHFDSIWYNEMVVRRAFEIYFIYNPSYYRIPLCWFITLVIMVKYDSLTISF